ncbi:MAG: PAS domain-containing protein, partial [Betaproteobacteria bacterium]
IGLTIVQDNKFVFANVRTSEIFGYPNEIFSSFSVQDLVNLIHPEDQGKMALLLQTGLNGETEAKRRVRIFTQDNKIRHLEASFRIVQFKGKPAIHQTFLDITDFYNT